MNQATKTEAEKYIQEHIPTMVGEHHVSSMELTTLISLLNGYASQSKWVSVEEPPEFGETVLVYCKIYGRFLATYEYIGEFNGEKYGNWRDFKGNLGILPPVWWMKIDEPPVEKS